MVLKKTSGMTPQHKRGFLFVVIVTAILAIVFSVLMVRNIREIRESKINESLWAASVEEASRKQEELEERKDRPLTEEEMIEIARRRFGLLFPNEIRFLPKK